MLLNSEPHPDHGGGLTVLQQASGAQLWASDASADSLASGGDDPDSVLPLRALVWIGVLGYPAARVDHRFKDGDTIRVGPRSPRTSPPATRAAARRGRSPSAMETAENVELVGAI